MLPTSHFVKAIRLLFSKHYIRATILTILILLCLVLTYYFHFILHKEVVFSHFFYIPIALAGFWLGRRGVWVAIFLAAILMASHLLSGTGIPVMENVLRSVMFVGGIYET